MAGFIKIRGARENNLKNVDLDIPKNKLVVFTGVSGSGESSLAFNTIYAERLKIHVLRLVLLQKFMIIYDCYGHVLGCHIHL